MGKFYIFGIIIVVVSLILSNRYVSEQFWVNNYFITLAIVVTYFTILFGSLISFLDDFFPKSKVAKTIKKIFETVIESFRGMS